jgi:hypothetical protein
LLKNTEKFESRLKSKFQISVRENQAFRVPILVGFNPTNQPTEAGTLNYPYGQFQFAQSGLTATFQPPVGGTQNITNDREILEREEN